MVAELSFTEIKSFAAVLGGSVFNYFQKLRRGLEFIYSKLFDSGHGLSKLHHQNTQLLELVGNVVSFVL